MDTKYLELDTVKISMTHVMSDPASIRMPEY